MTVPTVVILTAASGHGHMRIAEDIRSTLLNSNSRWDVVICDIGDFLAPSLRWMVEHFWRIASSSAFIGPFYGKLHRRVVSDLRLTGAMARVFRNCGNRLSDFFLKSDVRAVVAVHPAAVAAGCSWKKRTSFLLISCATDFVVHGLQTLPGVDCIFANPFSILLSPHLKDHNDRRLIFDPSFPSVRSVGGQAPICTIENTVRALVTFGGSGIGIRSYAGSIIKIARTHDWLHADILCGRDKILYNRLKNKIDHSNLATRVKIHLYREDVVDLMRNAHAVIGKAGGLTTHEVMNVGRPFLMMGVLPGQEEYNALVAEALGFGIRVSSHEQLQNILISIKDRNWSQPRALDIPRAVNFSNIVHLLNVILNSPVERRINCNHYCLASDSTYDATL